MDFSVSPEEWKTHFSMLKHFYCQPQWISICYFSIWIQDKTTPILVSCVGCCQEPLVTWYGYYWVTPRWEVEVEVRTVRRTNNAVLNYCNIICHCGHSQKGETIKVLCIAVTPTSCISIKIFIQRDGRNKPIIFHLGPTPQVQTVQWDLQLYKSP